MQFPGSDPLFWSLLAVILFLSVRNWILMRRIRKNIAELKDSRLEMAKTVNDFSRTADKVTASMREVIPLLERVGKEREDTERMITRMSSLRGDLVEIARKAGAVADRLETALRRCETGGSLPARHSKAGSRPYSRATR